MLQFTPGSHEVGLSYSVLELREKLTDVNRSTSVLSQLGSSFFSPSRLLVLPMLVGTRFLCFIKQYDESRSCDGSRSKLGNFVVKDGCDTGSLNGLSKPLYVQESSMKLSKIKSPTKFTSSLRSKVVH